MSNTLWALATAGVLPQYPTAFDFDLLPDSCRPTQEEIQRDPVTNCFRLFTEEMMHRIKFYKPQEIKDSLWAVAKVGLRHPRLFKYVAEHLVGSGDDPKATGRGLAPFDGQGVSNIAYVYAKHAQLGADVLQKYGKKARLPMTGGRLACYTVSYLDISEGLLRKLYAEIARVDLGAQSSGDSFVQSISAANEKFRQCQQESKKIDEHDQGTRNLQYCMGFCYKLYGDNGLEQSHINCLIYLQTLLDLELGKGNHPFALPDDFPSNWIDDPSKLSMSSDDSMVNHALEINTSNTQRSVSAAFDRVGFDHVDEHIYTMKDMAELFGIQMAAFPLEMLSLDIANVGSRVGIELDGPGHYITDIDNREDLLSDVGFYRPNNKGINEYVFNWNSHDQEINGSTALKLRIFDLLGWKVFNIDFWTWAAIYKNSKKEEEYCRSVLEKVA
ncbi:MAG: hypothetical protein SGARI_000327 [Bacillariaceae sp.]